MYWIYALLWLGLAMLGILNGVLRTRLYLEKLGDLRAHQVSTIVLIILVGVYTWLAGLLWPPQSTMQALLIGVLWFGMTVAFEFLFGRYVIGHPWSRLFQDYNILRGRVWSLVLLWTLTAPLAIYCLC